MNIVETAQAVPELSSLVAALSTAGLLETLAGDGPFTVFAPTNDAFDAISSLVLFPGLAPGLAGLTPEALIDVLTYHVVEAEARPVIDTPNEYNLSTLFAGHSFLLDNTLEFYPMPAIYTGVYPTGYPPQVTMADVVCSNGVVRIVDAVLIPRGLPDAMSIGETAVATPSLSTFWSLIVKDYHDAPSGQDYRDNLLDTLYGAGPFTVFAPTNDAFDAISSVVAGLTYAELHNVLTYHVIGAEAFAKDLLNGEVLATVFATHSLTVDLSVAGTVTITTESGGSAQVTLADVACSNGVIHVVDAVLIPNGLPAVLALSV